VPPRGGGERLGCRSGNRFGIGEPVVVFALARVVGRKQLLQTSPCLRSDWGAMAAASGGILEASAAQRLTPRVDDTVFVASWHRSRNFATDARKQICEDDFGIFG